VVVIKELIGDISHLLDLSEMEIRYESFSRRVKCLELYRQAKIKGEKKTNKQQNTKKHKTSLAVF